MLYARAPAFPVLVFSIPDSTFFLQLLYYLLCHILDECSEAMRTGIGWKIEFGILNESDEVCPFVATLWSLSRGFVILSSHELTGMGGGISKGEPIMN